MALTLNMADISGLPLAAAELLKAFPQSRIFLFEAEMGCGKTTFIKELCKQLGSTDNFSSPTFSIVNEYESPAGKLFHFDLYRLKDTEELAALGFYDYLENNSYVFMEWPQLAIPMLKGENVVYVKMQQKDGLRVLEADIKHIS